LWGSGMQGDGKDEIAEWLKAAHERGNGVFCMAMKTNLKISAVVMGVALGFWAIPGWSQSTTSPQPDSGVKHDVKKVGTKTADVSKDAAHDTAHGTKVAAKDTAHGTDVAATDTAHGTKKVANTTAKDTKTVGKDTAKGTEKAAHATASGTKKVFHKTASTTKGAVDGAKDGSHQ